MYVYMYVCMYVCMLVSMNKFINESLPRMRQANAMEDTVQERKQRLARERKRNERARLQSGREETGF